MAYGDNTYGADHEWSFNNVLTDSIGTLNLSNTGGVFVATPITRNSTHSYQTNGRDDLAVVGTDATSGASGFDRYAFQGWFMVSQIQGPPTLIYKQGGNTSGFALFLWAGNNVMLQVKDVNAANNIQIYSDIALTNNRPYHFLIRYSGSGFSNEIEFYLDGVKQTSNNGTVQPGAASMTAHTGNHTFGENGTTSIDVSVGDEAVLIKAPVNGFWSRWWTWFGGSAESITQTQIRDNLFGEGAIPGITIISDTEANMQIALDAIASTLRGDEPVNILVEEVSGGGALNLNADNITHDPRASIHVFYEGSGTLNWTNSNGSNASIGSQNVNFINPAIATITGLINGSEVRIYEDDGVDSNDFGTDLAGIETLSGTTFQYSHSGATNVIVIQMIADGYEEIRIRRTLTSANQTFNVSPIVETNI